MFTPCTRLPEEVWSLVFRLLSLSDRLQVRTTCKHFRELVDNTDLWRDRTVALYKSSEKYEEHFWDMLRRWRVTSALLSGPIKWADVTKELPGLTSLMINTWDFPDVKMQNLRGFTNLERLRMQFSSNVPFKALSHFMPQQLVHFKVCVEEWSGYKTFDLPAEIAHDSPFKKLKSLAFHCDFDPHPINVLHFFLSSLPQLQHLSLSMFVFMNSPYEGDISELPPLLNCSLSSLELLQCESSKFPVDLMKMLSPLAFLRSLAIYFTSEGYDMDNEDSLKLSYWLKDLPALTSLLVAPMWVGFAGSIPSSVTRLVLKPKYIMNSVNMAALSAQLPDLRQLFLEVQVPWDDPELDPEDPRLGPISEMALIPKLFPRLKTLCLSQKQVSEDAFLSLASLKELEVLEMLDKDPPPAALVSKLRALTNNRVKIHRSPEMPWKWSCGCWYSIPTDYWA